MLTAVLEILKNISIQTWLVFIIIFFVAYNYLTKETWKNLPPGPLALPILGSIPFLSADMTGSLMKMANKYGDVFTIYLGSTRVVVLNGYDAVKEAFAKSGHSFSGRPPIFFITNITSGYGIVSSQGEFWQEQRRHTLHVLRNFGVGRTILEDRILEEVEFFVKALRLKCNMPLYPQPLIQKSVANVIASVAFGRRYDYEDPLFKKYMKLMSDSFEIVGNGGALNLFPLLRYLPGDYFKYKRLMKDVTFMYKEYNRMVDEHLVEYDENKEPNDVIAAYIKTMKNDEGNPNTTYTVKQLTHVIGDLFGAGTETTSTTLTWALIYLTKHPEIQAKVRAEIDEVLETKEHVPRMEHRSRLPYTEACIAEVQRISDIVPLGVPHATTEDVTFRGHFIPRGTMVMPNMNSVHLDPKIWPEPLKFDPTRFLDEDGNLNKREEFIPFSLGKRVCLGEGLARMELFLYFVSMFQHFEFRLSSDHPPPDTQGILSITNLPKPFHIVVHER